jgi:hypothetical protein
MFYLSDVKVVKRILVYGVLVIGFVVSTVVTAATPITTVNTSSNTFPNVMSLLKCKFSSLTSMELPAMASTPRLTVGADYAGSAIPGSIYYPLIDNRIYKSNKFILFYNTQGRDVYRTQVDGGDNTVITFITDAPTFELDVQAQTTFSTPLIVDGIRASNTAYSAKVSSGNVRKVMKFDFGSSKVRKISFMAGYNIAGIYINQAYKLFPADTPSLSMFNLADSYGGGGYYGYDGKSTDLDLSVAVGIDGSAGSQIGGTGYNSRGNGNYKIAIERLQDYIAGGNVPNIISTFMGINDLGDAASIAAVNNYFQYAKTISPDILHIVTGPWAPQANQVVGQPRYKIMNKAILDALIANNLNYIFLDTLTGSIITSWGTVFDGAQYNINGVVDNNPNAIFTGSGNILGTGLGNTYLYIMPDNTHPTTTAFSGPGGTPSKNFGLDSGRAYLSKWVYNSVKQAINYY